MTEYSEINADYKCPICLRCNNDEDKPNLVFDGENNCDNPISNCVHYFCIECITQMVDRRCPLCREPISLMDRHQDLDLDDDEDLEQFFTRILRSNDELNDDIESSSVAEQIVSFYNEFDTTANNNGTWNFEAITSHDISFHDDYQQFMEDTIVATIEREIEIHLLPDSLTAKRNFRSGVMRAFANSSIIKSMVKLNEAIMDFEISRQRMGLNITGIERYIPFYKNAEYRHTQLNHRDLVENQQANEKWEDWVIIRLWIEW